MPGDTAPVNDFTSSLANFGAGRKNSFKLSTRLARECRGRNTPALAWSGILGCLSVRRYFRLAKKPWKASFRGTARLGTESLGRSFTPSWGDGFKSGWGISFNIMVSRHGAVLRLNLAQYIRFLIALSLVFALAVTLPNLPLRIAVAGAKPQINAALVLMSAVASPMTEELLFRGCLFGQLYRRAGEYLHSEISDAH